MFSVGLQVQSSEMTRQITTGSISLAKFDDQARIPKPTSYSAIVPTSMGANASLVVSGSAASTLRDGSKLCLRVGTPVGELVRIDGITALSKARFEFRWDDQFNLSLDPQSARE